MNRISKGINKRRAAWRMRSSPQRTALGDLPPSLESIWKASAPHEYPGIPTDAFFFACAAEGLMTFFAVAASSGKPCALPSEAADSVWHAWLRMDPIGLERFCRKHFGAIVPHVERARMGEGALLNTFATCHRLETGHSGQRRLRLPRLFSLDARLRMPNGNGYWHDPGGIVHARIGRQGWGHWRARPHSELDAEALHAAGLIDRQTQTALLRRRHAAGRARADTGCGSGGVDLPLAAFASDGASDGGCSDGGSGGDAGCDSGSSCGSSCGTSCGSSCGGGD
jgi:hypothetical protein